jgi:hypothetical protein
MPQYHVFSRIKDTDKGWRSEGIITGKHGVRSAWSAFKKSKRGRKRIVVDPGREYFFFAINHARIWQHFKKWNIASYYGNHEQKKHQEKVRKLLEKQHSNNRQKD